MQTIGEKMKLQDLSKRVLYGWCYIDREGKMHCAEGLNAAKTKAERFWGQAWRDHVTQEAVGFVK